MKKREDIRYIKALVFDCFTSIITGIILNVLYTSQYWENLKTESIYDIWNNYCAYIDYRISLNADNYFYLVGYYIC